MFCRRFSFSLFFLPLYCLFFLGLRFLITPLGIFRLTYVNITLVLRYLELRCAASLNSQNYTYESPPVCSWSSCYSIFNFMCIFCRSFFVIFLLANVLSVLLRFTDSGYPFDIFKLFLAYRIPVISNISKYLYHMTDTCRFVFRNVFFPTEFSI